MEIKDLVGNTPLVKIDNVYLKLEYLNPTGSHKDRIALYMLRDVENKGYAKGTPVIEYTSGNTGISVAWASKFFGYKPVIFVPHGTSREKVNMIRALGAETIIVPPEEDGHILAEKLAEEINGFYLEQTKNRANFRAHYETTGPELLSQAEDLDCFVMGAGTGGTIYGIGKYLKERNEKIKIVLLIPKGSELQKELFDEVEKDAPILEGFSYHSFTELLKMAFDENIIDEIVVVDSEMSIKGVKALLSAGILGGFTSGANYYHALKISKERDCKVATLVADSIVRYSSLMDIIL